MTAAVEAVLDRADEPDPPTFLLCDADLGAVGAGAAGLGRGGCEGRLRPCRRRPSGIASAVASALRCGFARWAIERRCGYRAEAPISGQRAMAAEVLRAVLPFASGYGMETGMTIDAVRAGFRLCEIELDLEHRATGRSVGGFLHRARQLRDFGRAYASRRAAV